jgi:hypothetical protein
MPPLPAAAATAVLLIEGEADGRDNLRLLLLNKQRREEGVRISSADQHLIQRWCRCHRTLLDWRRVEFASGERFDFISLEQQWRAPHGLASGSATDISRS